jgi:hypothetical protein
MSLYVRHDNPSYSFLYCGECGSDLCRKVRPGPFGQQCEADSAAPMPHRDYVCTCDEADLDSHVCDPCSHLTHAYWAAYFGQDYGSPEERRSRLEAMDPRPVTHLENDR